MNFGEIWCWSILRKLVHKNIELEQFNFAGDLNLQKSTPFDYNCVNQQYYALPWKQQRILFIIVVVDICRSEIRSKHGVEFLLQQYLSE